MRAEEAEEKRREAEERRRQTELLVDVTSHGPCLQPRRAPASTACVDETTALFPLSEIRNPVSAILQNAGLCKSNLVGESPRVL